MPRGGAVVGALAVRFLGLSSLGAVLACSSPDETSSSRAVDDSPAALAVSAVGPDSVRDADGAAALARWLEARARVTHGPARDLYYAYYDAETGERSFISTAVSADVVRFLLARGDVDRAVATGYALLGVQHAGAGPAGERLRGAFPSEIHPTGEPLGTDQFDSADNLAVVEALVDLYATTRDPIFLDAVERAAGWLRDVMSHGERVGVWCERLPGLMRLVTREGAFDNRIPVGRSLFWLPTLERVARVLDAPEFAELAAQGRAFAALGQGAHGGFADHYDPGWPAQPFSPDRFRPWGMDGAVFADDSLRAALGLAATDPDAADRFLDWLDVDAGKVHGYLGWDDGAARFVPGDRPYYDVIATALYRELVGPEAPLAARAEHYLATTQGPDGAWHWGRVAATGEPVDSLEATLTGLWAVQDLAPSGER